MDAGGVRAGFYCPPLDSRYRRWYDGWELTMAARDERRWVLDECKHLQIQVQGGMCDMCHGALDVEKACWFCPSEPKRSLRRWAMGEGVWEPNFETGDPISYRAQEPEDIRQEYNQGRHVLVHPGCSGCLQRRWGALSFGDRAIEIVYETMGEWGITENHLRKEPELFLKLERAVAAKIKSGVYEALGQHGGSKRVAIMSDRRREWLLSAVPDPIIGGTETGEECSHPGEDDEST